MKQTLQDQYLLIKEGKGHKGVFLTEAKRQFPNIVRNAATFEEAAASLITKNIISENVVGITAVAGYEPRKKESYETAFEDFLAEAKKKVAEDEKVKAEEKKVSKTVEEDLDKMHDNTDEKNPDNMIFDQIMMGYYAEMKDPKNADKTMQELKDIVFKNLSKDPIYYTKDGQFGVKGLGYATEAPGLGEPKEPKGKYKSSGYGDLNEGMVGKNYPGEIEGEYEGTPLKMMGSDMYDYLKDILDISNSEDDFVKKVIYGITDETSSISSNDENKLRIWYRKNSSDLGENLEKFKSDVKGEFEKKPNRKFTDEELKAYLKKKREEELERRKEAGEPLEEIRLREIIREIIDEELEEVRGGGNYGILTINPSGGGGGRRFVPDQIALPLNIRKRFGDHMAYNSANGTFYISQILYNNLIKGYADQPAIKKLIMDIPMMVKQLLNKTENYGPVVNLPKEFKTYLPFIAPVEKAKEDKFNKAGDKQYWAEGDFLFPNLNKEKYSSPEGDSEEMAESLMESVEKDLAAINKEAEHEILQSKLDKIQDLIDKRQSQLGKLDEDEDMKALTDKKKVKELEKDIKKLDAARKKVEKMMSKFKGKKKEVIDEDESEGVDDDYVAPEYEEDAYERQDMGQEDDSILSNYNNLSFNGRVNLRQKLEAREDKY